MSMSMALPAVSIAKNMQNHMHSPRFLTPPNLSAAASASGYFNGEDRNDAAPVPTASLVAAPPSFPPAYDEAATPLAAPITLVPTEPLAPASDSDDLLTKLPPARFKVTPREDEGHEQLPAYEATLHKTALFDFKLELSDPFTRAIDRTWRSAYVILNTTALAVHRPRRKALLGNTLYPGESADSTMGYEPGLLLGQWTLQNAEVGVAADYMKRHFVIRVRAEKVQMLFSMRSLARMLEWIEALSAAIDLSPPLELRAVPRYQTIPRRRRRSPEEIRREQEEIIRRQFPHLLQEEGERVRPQQQQQQEHEDDVDIDAVRAAQPASAPASVRRLDATIPESPRRSNASLPVEMTRCHSASSTSSSSSSASIRSTSSSSSCASSDQKWAPQRTLTAHNNLMFARRTMPILCRESPRRSEVLISEGKRWRIDYEGQRLLELGVEEGVLPGYSAVGEDEGLA